jgi:hypothetical protein
MAKSIDTLAFGTAAVSRFKVPRELNNKCSGSSGYYIKWVGMVIVPCRRT